jgi:excisionase family DNA binding protein
MKTPITIKKYYSTQEFADLLGVSRITIFNRIKRGQIKAKKIGRNYIIPYENIESYFLGELSDKIKKEIDAAVIKVINDYGGVLQKLGKE